MKRAAVIAAVGLLSACSGQSGSTSPTPTPLPPVALQLQYVTAAGAFDAARSASGALERDHCDSRSSAADLTRCEQALSAERAARLVFDGALRTIAFPAVAQDSLAALLSTESQLESMLQQASAAPSLMVIGLLQPQIAALAGAADTEAMKLRVDAGLGSGSAPPAPPPG